MKNLIAQFKAMGFKNFVLEHAEKGVFGVAALMVLIFVGGTSWSRYDKQPEQFVKKAEDGEKAILASDFSEAEKEKLRPKRPLMEDVKRLHTAIDVSHYEYSTHWFWPMYPQVQKVSEPKLLAAREPVADPGKFIMVELPEQQQVAAVAADADSPKVAASNTGDDDDLAPKLPKEGARGGPGAAGLSGPNATGFGTEGLSGARANMASSDGAYGMSSMGNASKPVNSRGVRFVSVRYLFPLDEQITEFMKAMNLDKKQAAELIMFLDFELERQTAVPGNKPWSGKWEKVDIQAALDILDRVDFDPELVDQKFTDAVITMPLPRRAAGAGSWGKTAYHKKLQQLKEEEVTAQRLLMEKAVEKAEEMKKQDKFRRRGFAEKQHDARGVRQQTSGMMGDMSKSVSAQYSSAENSSAMPAGFDSAQFGQSVENFGNQMKQDVGTTTQYLLFRYFDFAVTPGNAYKYRVRLVLRNPNFQRPVEELIDEKVAAGEKRETPWSESTPPVSIAEENRVFLAKAERAKADTGLPSASMEVFQWFADSGMNIFAKLEKLQMGQIISGRPKTEVLRPASGSFREEEIPIFTGAVLADLTLSQIPELDQTEHADLKVDFRKLKQMASVDKALIVDRFGQMIELDPKSNGDDLAKAQKTMEKQGKDWEPLKKPQGATGGMEDRLLQLTGRSGSGNSTSPSSDPAMMMGGMMGMMGGGTNPLKKGAGGNAATTGKKGAKPKTAPRNSGSSSADN